MLHPRLARLFSYLFGHEYCIFCVAALEECCFELPFVDWHLERCLAEEMRDRSPVRRRTLCVHGCIDAFCHGISHMAMDARQKEKRERERERERVKSWQRGGFVGKRVLQRKTMHLLSVNYFHGLDYACWFRLHHMLFSLPETHWPTLCDGRHTHEKSKTPQRTTRLITLSSPQPAFSKGHHMRCISLSSSWA